jgi:hypothetical protein
VSIAASDPQLVASANDTSTAAPAGADLLSQLLLPLLRQPSHHRAHQVPPHPATSPAPEAGVGLFCACTAATLIAAGSLLNRRDA